MKRVTPVKTIFQLLWIQAIPQFGKFIYFRECFRQMIYYNILKTK